MTDRDAYLKRFSFQPARGGLDARGAARYRRTDMCRQLSRLGIVLGVALLAGCTRAVPGVLTLAPGGMRTTGTAVPHPDGTLDMSPGATAESVIYVDAGPATITVTASTAANDPPRTLGVWFAGTRVGGAEIQSTQAASFAFHVQPRTSGPTALRVEVAAARSPSEDSGFVHIEKIVITQP